MLARVKGRIGNGAVLVARGGSLELAACLPRRAPWQGGIAAQHSFCGSTVSALRLKSQVTRLAMDPARGCDGGPKRPAADGSYSADHKDGGPA
jgi:hypothetical protein